MCVLDIFEQHQLVICLGVWIPDKLPIDTQTQVLSMIYIYNCGIGIRDIDIIICWLKYWVIDLRLLADSWGCVKVRPTACLMKTHSETTQMILYFHFLWLKVAWLGEFSFNCWVIAVILIDNWQAIAFTACSNGITTHKKSEFLLNEYHQTKWLLQAPFFLLLSI